jgi:hypothetical protein
MAAKQLRIQQREIEFGVRRQIGLLLHAQAKPGERVFLEPLGYIGFFSGMKMLDYPGLASREVVAARRQLKTDAWGAIITQLKPEWLVLRPKELVITFRQYPNLENEYAVSGVADATPRLDKYGWIPGRPYLDFDSRFAILRRKADAP